MFGGGSSLNENLSRWTRITHIVWGLVSLTVQGVQMTPGQTPRSLSFGGLFCLGFLFGLGFSLGAYGAAGLVHVLGTCYRTLRQLWQS